MVDNTRQLKLIEEELQTMQQLRYKLSNQLRHFKELHLFRSVIKRTGKCIKLIQTVDYRDVKQIDKLPAAPAIKQIAIVMLQCEKLGRLLKEFISRVFLIQFATLGIASIAVVHQNLLKMRKKLDAIARVQQERQSKVVSAKQKTALATS